MQLGFRSDIFSKFQINWNNRIDKETISNINFIVKTYISSSDYNIKKNKGLELNSNNFKINFRPQKFLLKKWSNDMEASKIKNVLNLMIWLNAKKLPVQMPQLFKNGKYLIKYKKNFWSFFNYVEGNHFKGNVEEFKNTVKHVGKLTNILQNYPMEKFNKAPNYFSTSDYKILKLMNKKNFKFKKKFGKYSKNIRIYLPEIIKLFEKYKNFNSGKNKKKVGHIDLHPHNIITKNNRVKALLDIDSCKVIKDGYAIAYNALKICKQTAIYNKKKVDKKKIGTKFISILRKEYKINRHIRNNFYYFAISEVLRRLVYMFKLTIKNNDKKWNRIIPIQLGHLDECREFFLEKH